MSGSTLDIAFTSCVGTFLSGVLPEIVTFVRDNADDSVDTLVTKIREEMNLPAVSSKPLPLALGSFATGGALAPSIGGSYPGLASGVPPPGTGTAGASKRGPPKKSSKPEQLWIPLEEFWAKAGPNNPICAYNPPRVPKTGVVCGAVVAADIMAECGENFLTYRCSNCKGKTGKIGTRANESQVAAPKAAGGLQVPLTAGVPKAIGAPALRGMIPVPRMKPIEKPVEVEKTADFILEERSGYDGVTFSERFPKYVFKRDGESVVCVGKFEGDLDDDAPPDFVDKLLPLSMSEAEELASETKIEFKSGQSSPPKPKSRMALPRMPPLKIAGKPLKLPEVAKSDE